MNAGEPSQPTVLVVEDDPDIRMLLAFSLRKVDCRVEQAVDGASALAAVDRLVGADGGGPGLGLVTLDLGLPDIDGLEVCRRLREVWSGPVLVVSALVSAPGWSDKALAAGATEVWTKPFRPHDIAARVTELLG